MFKVNLDSLGGLIKKSAKHCKRGNRARSRNFEFKDYHGILALHSICNRSAFVVRVVFVSVVDWHLLPVVAQAIGLRHDDSNDRKENEQNEGAIFQEQSNPRR